MATSCEMNLSTYFVVFIMYEMKYRKRKKATKKRQKTRKFASARKERFISLIFFKGLGIFCTYLLIQTKIIKKVDVSNNRATIFAPY